MKRAPSRLRFPRRRAKKITLNGPKGHLPLTGSQKSGVSFRYSPTVGRQVQSRVTLPTAPPAGMYTTNAPAGAVDARFCDVPLSAIASSSRATCAEVGAPLPLAVFRLVAHSRTFPVYVPASTLNTSLNRHSPSPRVPSLTPTHHPSPSSPPPLPPPHHDCRSLTATAPSSHCTISP